MTLVEVKAKKEVVFLRTFSTIFEVEGNRNMSLFSSTVNFLVFILRDNKFGKISSYLYPDYL